MQQRKLKKVQSLNCSTREASKFKKQTSYHLQLLHKLDKDLVQHDFS